MSKLDFRRNPEAAGVAPVQQVSEIVSTPAANLTVECQTTVAPAGLSIEGVVAGLPAVYVPPGLPAVAPAPFLMDDENITLDQVKFPFLNIVQKVGEMSNTWTPGQIILDQQSVLFNPEQPAKGQDPARPASAPVEITVFGFQKTRFSEKVKGGARGLTVNSTAEVAAVGGTLSWDEARLKRIKLFQPLDTAVIFIARPDDFKDEENIIFSLPFGGKRYAMALWNLKGAAGQKHGATVIRSDALLRHLKLDGKPCFRAFTYSLSTKLTSSVIESETVWYHVPSLKPGHRNSPEFFAFMNESLGLPA